jgi:hypothetical protein
MADSFEVVDRDELRRLLQHEASPAISLFHPTERATFEPERNTLRLKNLISQAHDLLARRGLRRRQIEELAQPLNELLGEGEFWRHQLDGLAVYRSPELLRFYRLPFGVDERVVVSDRLYVKPLLSALAAEGHFYILALSQKAVRLLRATQHSIAEVPLDDLGIPRSLAEALQYDDIEKGDLQHRPSAGPGATGRTQAPGRSGRGQRHIFHGHGPGDEDAKNDILRFFQGVDRGLVRLLGADQTPVMLAGVDYLHPLFRQASSYRAIVDRGIEGNPDQLSPAQLHERAWPLIAPRFRAPIERAKRKFAAQIGTGLASSDLGEILRAANDGRIESLFVERGKEVWGTYDPAANELRLDGDPTPSGLDLLDLAGKETLLRRGDVFLLDREDMPCEDPAAAVFRF